MSRTMIADKLAMTGTEKNIAFDAKGELVAAPAGKNVSARNPPSRRRPGRDGSGDDRIRRPGRRTTGTPQEARSRTRHLRTTDGPAWASGNF